MKLVVYTFLLCVCCVSCNKKLQNQPKVLYETLQCLNCSDYLPNSYYPEYKDIKFVPLETRDSCLMSEISQIVVNDFLIFVLDINRQLFVFNINGKFISKIGKYGQGPEEYLTINTFYIENDHIVIIDDVKSSLIRYDFKGAFLSAEKFPTEYFRMSGQAMQTDDDKLLVQHGINMEANMAYSLIDVNKHEMTGQYFSYNPIKLNNYIYYYSNHPMAKSNKGVDFILPLCDTVYCYSNASLFPKYLVEIPYKMASKNQIRKNTDSYTRDIFTLGQQNFFTGFTAIFETSNHILLEYRDNGVILGYFLCDMTSKQGYYYLYTMKEEATQIPFFRIMGAVKNTFIGVSQPSVLRETDWKIPGEIGQQFEKMISGLQEDDNPILFFYQLVDN